MLITSAPALIAREIARAESEHVIRSPSGSGTLSARAPGQTPRKPTPLAGAAATVVVAVPWKSRSSPPGAALMPEPAISGCVSSIRVSMTASSGLLGVARGATASPTTKSRQVANGESGS
jgi:hypothetical protein